MPLAALLATTALPACGGASPATSATLGASAAAMAAANPVAVSPMPGTPDASPATQISFLGGPGTQVVTEQADRSLLQIEQPGN